MQPVPFTDDRPPRRVPLFHGAMARGIGLVVLVAPIALAPVLARDFFELPWPVMAVALVGNAVPCWSAALAVYAAYRLVLARILPRVVSSSGRLLAHAGVSAAAASASALLVRPAMELFSNRVPPALGFAAASVIIAWAIVFPCLVIEQQQDLAAEKDRRIQSERRAALQAELDALRARTQPHFLFNSLNTIAGLIPERPALAEATVERLASVLRHVLSSSVAESVALADEMDILVDYLEVQKARFGDRLRYRIAVEPGIDRVRVPPLILQPLVENAVLHGVSRRAAGGLVQVEARVDDATLELRVQDDGGGELRVHDVAGGGESDHRGSGTSLRDLRRRLEILYGGDARLVTHDAEGGFVVEVRLPVGALESAAGAPTAGARS